jgi:L-rhamnose-H+ transport protein
MSKHEGLGLALVLFAGLLNGSFALPMKRMAAWKWENTWLVYSIIGMVACPWAYAVATVPHLAEVYDRASWHTLLMVLLFGFAAGTGSMLFGLGISRLGIALGFAIILGISASLGSLLPLAILHPDQLLSRQAQILIGGTLLVIFGIVFYAIAGRRRERETVPPNQVAPSSGFGVGLVICIVSGVLSAMLNFSFLFGKELQDLTLRLGGRPSATANPIWALAVTSGSISSIGYSIYLLQKNRSWHMFYDPGISVGYWFGGIVMGLLWFGSVAFYGMGAAALGSLGGIIGWPVLMAMIIITANLWGAITGEWAKASRRSFAYSWAGMAVLLLAVYIISLASRAR